MSKISPERIRLLFKDNLGDEERKEIENAIESNAEAGQLFREICLEQLSVPRLIGSIDLTDSADSDPGMSQKIRDELERLAKADYWSIDEEQGNNPLMLFGSHTHIELNVKRLVGVFEQPFSVALERIADDPPRFRLGGGEFPTAYDLHGVMLTKLRPFALLWFSREMTKLS